jgi:Flp pilus assembly pilin Flp
MTRPPSGPNIALLQRIIANRCAICLLFEFGKPFAFGDPRLALEQTELFQSVFVGGHPGKERNDHMNILKRLFTDESAQDLAEYGIALAVIAAGAGAVALVIAGDVSTLWQTASTAIAAAV